MTNLGHQPNPSRRRRTRAAQLIFTGAAAAATFALFATDDTNFVNDQGQTSGDIFTQNAQDQN